MDVVKNRRKDGGFYWVMSYVSPTYEEDKSVGYVSVQVKPTTGKLSGPNKTMQRSIAKNAPTLLMSAALESRLG
ncbi:MAG TPA: hypothetical protein VK032_06350 [Burkholderiaceae bacterium]|nr:hypothetical protein [Burkholderiaceae bacterium]